MTTNKPKTFTACDLSTGRSESEAMTHYLPGGAVRLPAPPRPNRNNNAQGKAMSMIKVEVVLGAALADTGGAQ